MAKTCASSRRGNVIAVTFKKIRQTEDVIQPTLEAWYRVITYKKSWDMELDKVRFETAFMTLGQTSDWFPTPKQLLEALPQHEIS